MKIIGLNHDMYISSAALIDGGKIIAAAAEERFTRDKQTRVFPKQALHYCLDQAQCSITDIDHFATAWNPGIYMNKYNPLFSSHRRFKGEYLYSVPDNIMSLYSESESQEVEYIQQTLVMQNHPCSVYHVTHHRAHAGNAFFISPFEEAAIMTADSQGELESTSMAVGKGNKIQILNHLLHPNSLGAFYATFTEYLGFKPHSDEWKVMALAAYAEGENHYLKIMGESVIKLNQAGTFDLNMTYFKDFLHELPHLYTDKLVETFGPARKSDQPLEARHYAIAAAIQYHSEQAAFHILNKLHADTGQKNLCVSGGFFMNSVLNGKILANTKFEKLYLSSCPDDSGNAIGSAYYLYNHILDNQPRFQMIHNYYGPSYSNDVIKETLFKYGIDAQFEENITLKTAELIADGKLIGWFQGAMEFGQRALGNRSILADPRNTQTKDKVNLAVKYREKFRPFAPAVLAEKAALYFDLDDGMTVPFMEKVYPIKIEKRALIPAVVHDDGSGRLQTVNSKINPRFHQLISHFERITGVPVLLNTSFNLNGEPVVCNPTDAIKTFFSCGLDVLVLGNYMIRKVT